MSGKPESVENLGEASLQPGLSVNGGEEELEVVVKILEEKMEEVVRRIENLDVGLESLRENIEQCAVEFQTQLQLIEDEGDEMINEAITHMRARFDELSQQFQAQNEPDRVEFERQLQLIKDEMDERINEIKTHVRARLDELRQQFL